MAATEQLFNTRERKRFERHDIWERIAENGTISAAVMVIAAIAAVACFGLVWAGLVGLRTLQIKQKERLDGLAVHGEL